MTRFWEARDHGGLFAESGRGPCDGARVGRELLVALVNGNHLEIVVPQAIDCVSHDPLTRVHFFRGDLLRCLMEVPDAFWTRHTSLYEQYRAAVRAGAQARLQLPAETRLAFWSPLELRETS